MDLDFKEIVEIYRSENMYLMEKGKTMVMDFMDPYILEIVKKNFNDYKPYENELHRVGREVVLKKVEKYTFGDPIDFFRPYIIKEMKSYISDFYRIVEMCHSKDAHLVEMSKILAIEKMEGYIVTLLSKTFGSYKKYQEDLYQEGVLGVLKGLPDYNPQIAKATTFFRPYILHQMSAYITSFVSQSTAHYQKNNKLICEVEKRYERAGKVCTDTDISIETGINIETIIQTRQIDRKVINHIESTNNDFFSMERQERSPESIISEKESKNILIKHINSLKPIEQKVIDLIFYQGYSQKNTAIALDIKIEDVRKYKEKAIQKLRYRMGDTYYSKPKDETPDKVSLIEIKNAEDTMEVLDQLKDSDFDELSI